MLQIARHAGESQRPGLWNGLRCAVPLWAASPGGVTVPDMARQNSGVLTSGAPSTDWVTGARFGGYGLNFSGATSRVEMTGSGAASDRCNITGKGLTVSAWVDCDSFTAFDNIVVKTSSAAFDNGFGLMQFSTNAFRWWVNTYNVNFVNVTGFATGTLYHLVGTYNGTIIEMYVNGVSQGTDTLAVDVTTTTNVLAIGGLGLSPSYTLDGRVYDVRVWDRALGVADILDLYRDPKAMYRVRASQVKAPAATAFYDLQQHIDILSARRTLSVVAN